MFRHSASLFVCVLLAVGMMGCSVEANDPVPEVPRLVSPIHQGNNLQTSIELQWELSENADTYDLQVSDEATFASNVIDRTGMTGHFFVLRELELGKTYHWRVRASNEFGGSDWTDAWSFAPQLDAVRPGPPGLLIPQDSTKNLEETVSFSWEKVEGATHYHLQVALEPNYIRKVANAELLRTNSMSVTQLVDTYIYFWRVRAINPEGPSPWSSSRILAVGETQDWVPIFGNAN